MYLANSYVAEHWANDEDVPGMTYSFGRYDKPFFYENYYPIVYRYESDLGAWDDITRDSGDKTDNPSFYHALTFDSRGFPLIAYNNLNDKFIYFFCKLRLYFIFFVN